MHPDTKKVAEHIKDFGLHSFGAAIVDAIFLELGKPYAHALSVVRCAHAAELIIKAKISEQHPLLLFERLPKTPKDEINYLDIATLIRDGKTIMYSDLPDLLWATTGYRINELERYQSFGRLRNAINHFAIPDVNLVAETLQYGFSVVEPLIREFWKVDVITYLEEYDPDCEETLMEALDEHKIIFHRHQ